MELLALGVLISCTLRAVTVRNDVTTKRILQNCAAGYFMGNGAIANKGPRGLLTCEIGFDEVTP